MDRTRSKKNVFIYLFLLLLILAPGLRLSYKYLNVYAGPFFLITSSLIAIFYFQIVFTNRLQFAQKILESPYFLVLWALIILVFVSHFYPIADALKLELRGSDQDDCILMGSAKILQLSHPYIERTYYGNPCSPGPGLLILYIPFVWAKIYSLGSVFSMLLMGWAIYKNTSSVYFANTALMLLSSSMLTLDLLATGSDLILLGCGIATLSLCLISVINNKSRVSLVILAIFCGLLASSRVNFMILSPLLSVFIYLHWKRGAVFFMFTALITSIAPSLIIFLSDPEQFTPLHLVMKSQRILPTFYTALAIIISALATIFALLKVKNSVSTLPSGVFLALLPALLAVSLGDLFFIRDGNFSNWEGANYLMPLIPLASTLIVGLAKNNGLNSPQRAN